MVECTALEMRRGCKLTVGSNPTLSATVTLIVGIVDKIAIDHSAGVALRPAALDHRMTSPKGA